MAVDSNDPAISELCRRVEEFYKKSPCSPADFRDLSDDIKSKTKTNISQSTLERLWEYGRKRYRAISLYTLNTISRYIGFRDWKSFVDNIKLDRERESKEFKSSRLLSRNLTEGTKIRIGWAPDRICVLRYLGKERFIAEDCKNSTMNAGATFTCLQFQIGRELVMNDFKRDENDMEEGKSYVVAMNNGLLFFEIL